MATRRALPLALCSLLLAGCATRGTQSPPSGGEKSPSAAQPPRIVPGPVQVVGRVIAIDPRTLFVMVEVAPFTVVPTGFDGRVLISRMNNLTPTARLRASPYLRGRILGARLLAGRPNVGDEVVFAPETL